MKTRHLLLAISMTAIWGVNFSAIKLGLATVDPLKLSPLAHTIWMTVSYVAVAALLVRQKSADSVEKVALPKLPDH